jgi:hypothetical protein
VRSTLGVARRNNSRNLVRSLQVTGQDRLVSDRRAGSLPHVAGCTLRDDFGVNDLEIIKAGVTREQIGDYELPPQNFAKEKSSNYDWFVDRNDGDDTVYELEALDPAVMLEDLEDTITSVLDMELYNAEVAAEKDEAAYLEAAQKKVVEVLHGIGD